ncbi:MAG: hypothetical protein KDD33_01080 [Bdellovibrionales bacterium]|nr:hypothetical protein [Bdellovibrionales bacterium]
MKITRIIAVGLALLALGCQADPGEKLIPAEKEKKIIDKGLEDVTFNPAVDILFIVDDSFSMDEEQTNMGVNSALFVDEIFKSRFIDYHIGVMTASPTFTGSKSFGGRLVMENGVNYVERNTPNGKSLLNSFLNVGTGSLSQEEFFSIAIMGLTPPVVDNYNKGFYRDDAHLAIIFVTDTEDQSFYSSSEFIEFLLKLKNYDRNKVHLTGALVETLTTSWCQHEDQPGGSFKIKEAINEFRGGIFELCSTDYGTGLAKAAQEIVRGVSTIYLDSLPVLNTLRVTYAGVDLPQGQKGWTYDPVANAIRISEELEIDYVGSADLKVTFESVYR